MTGITKYRMGNLECPICHGTLSGATPTRDMLGPAPEPGDFSLCIYCGNWLVFTDTLDLRLPTDGEALAIGTDPHMIGMYQAWLATR